MTATAIGAIRVHKRGKSGFHTVHLLADPDRTFCGHAVSDMLEPERIEFDTSRVIERCQQCIRLRDSVKFSRGQRRVDERAPRITAKPAPGRVRTTGPLYHGPRTRGHRLAP